MPNGNPYQALVSAYADLVRGSADPGPGSGVTCARPELGTEAPTTLVFSPHPDDECIVGALPLRLLRERAQYIINVSVTLGSRTDRRAQRWREVCEACRYLGFDVLSAAEQGLEKIVPATRTKSPDHWAAAAAVITDIIASRRPAIVFVPHAGDWNRTHIGTHLLVLDALARMPSDFSCLVLETEFWGAMATPNLMVESSVEDVADLVRALSMHRGEVARNPYHLRLPAWMIDNVRRGAELVQGQGEAAPDFAFATLYRLRQWASGQLRPAIDRGHCVARHDDLAELFAA